MVVLLSTLHLLWGGGLNLRDKPPMVLGGRVGIDIAGGGEWILIYVPNYKLRYPICTGVTIKKDW